MAVFSVTITNASRLAGIAAARETYNESKGPDIRFVMGRAAASYALQYGT